MIKIVLYYHPIEYWEEWVQGTIDHRVTDPVNTQIMGVILSQNSRN